MFEDVFRCEWDGVVHSQEHNLADEFCLCGNDDIVVATGTEEGVCWLDQVLAVIGLEDWEGHIAQDIQGT